MLMHIKVGVRARHCSAVGSVCPRTGNAALISASRLWTIQKNSSESVFECLLV